MTNTSFTVLTAFSTPRQISDVVNNMMRGKLNNTAEVTLTNSATSTVVTNYVVGPKSVIIFMPITSDAATEQAAGGFYVSAQQDNQFTITHSSATTTRTFRYVVIG